MQINFDAKQYIGKREEQQDSFVSVILDADNGFQLHVLADGMGGHNAGSVASKVVCQSFVQYFEHNSLQSPEQDLKSALEYANDSIAQMLKQKPELAGMGTTVIAVIYNEKSNQYSYISVGDSPLYVFNQGCLQRINANHAYYEKLLKMVEAGVISQQDADNDPQRHAITSAIMGTAIPEIDVKTRLLKENDVLIMASDGLQTLDDSAYGEIAQIANQYGYHHEKLTSELLKAVQQRNNEYQDNTSIIVIQSSISLTQKEIAPPKTYVENISSSQYSEPDEIKKSSKTLWCIVTILLMFTVGIASFFMLKTQYHNALAKGDGSDKNTIYAKIGLNKLSPQQKAEPTTKTNEGVGQSKPSINTPHNQAIKHENTPIPNNNANTQPNQQTADTSSAQSKSDVVKQPNSNSNTNKGQQPQPTTNPETDKKHSGILDDTTSKPKPPETSTGDRILK